jgi:phosphoribosylglycinamide formyltransferase-1
VLNIAVLVSGGGSNLQALIDAKTRGELPRGRLALVVSSKARAYALKRAEAAGIQTAVLRPADYPSSEHYAEALTALLTEAKIDLIVLAGFLVVLPKSFTQRFAGRIINVHPSLIPSFCGPGYYGLRVHQAALDYGVKLTGATVHYVTEVVDGGRIILQKGVEVHPDDTPETLQRRVMEEAEWVILPKAVALLCDKFTNTEGELP